MTVGKALLRIVLAGVLPSGTGCDEDGGGTPKQDAGADGAQGLDTSEDRPLTDAIVTNDTGTTAADGAQETRPQTDGGRADGNGSCFPSCLNDLVVDCVRLGQSCVEATLANGNVVICYENGVKALATTSSTTVKKASGEPCFQIVPGASGGNDYFDPRGTVVAHLDAPTSSIFQVMCADGMAATVDLTAPECASTVAAMRTCSAGACAW